MSSLFISTIVFACIFGGALVGMVLRSNLPAEHLSADSKEVIKLAAGIIGTMTALMLGLLVASAKSSFDTQRDGLVQLSANVILLDRVLAHYGTEAKEARETLRGSVADMIERTWPQDHSGENEPSATTGRYEGLFEQVQALVPTMDAQRFLKTEALSLLKDTAQMRWSLFAHPGGSIPAPLFVVIVVWLTFTLAFFSILARPNATMVAALLLCSLAVASAIFLISELDRPFHGMIQISSAPLQTALEELGK